METINVLVTSVGTATAQSIIKGLRSQNEIKIFVVGVDINKKNETAGSRFCDKYYRVPLGDNKNFISNLLQISLKNNIKVLFPVHDSELYPISRARDKFLKNNIFTWVSHPKTIRICNDKYESYKFFIANKIETPKTVDLTSLKKRLTEFNFPAILKPRHGVGSKNIYVVNTMDELLALQNRVEYPLIQEFIKGDEYTVDVLCDSTGKPIASVPRLRIETKAGVSSKGITVKHVMLSNHAKRLARLLNIKGACNIQYIVSKDDLPKCIEINPRFSGTTALTIGAGVNSPLILLKLALGKPLDQKFYHHTPGVYMARYWDEHFFSK